MSELVSVDLGVDPGSLSRRARIERLAELERVKAQLEAAQARVLAALADEGSTACGDRIAARADRDWVREEVACALRVSGLTAAERLSLARELTTRLPATLAALARGEVSGAMARRLAETAVALDDEVSARVEQRVLPRAAGQTFAQFGQALRRAVLQEDLRGQQERHEAAVADRRVSRRAIEDGMAELWAVLPADRAAACWDRLDAVAHRSDLDAGDTGERDGGMSDERSMDQRRADALVALLTAEAGAATPEALSAGTSRRVQRRRRRARRAGPAVHVTVALSTLLGLDEQPGELAGHGPIPAELARRIARDPSGTWRRLVTDEEGRLLRYGRTTYRPPAALVNHVRTRDVTCRFPTCTRRAAFCELDHVYAWEHGGTTDADNLHPLCSRHHHLKHEAGWTVRRLRDGTTEWASPTGHRYRRPPEQLPIDTTGQFMRRPRPSPSAYPGDPPEDQVA